MWFLCTDRHFVMSVRNIMCQILIWSCAILSENIIKEMRGLRLFLVNNLGVTLCEWHVRVSEQFAHSVDVCSLSQHQRSKRVFGNMEGNMLLDPSIIMEKQASVADSFQIPECQEQASDKRLHYIYDPTSGTPNELLVPALAGFCHANSCPEKGFGWVIACKCTK